MKAEEPVLDYAAVTAQDEELSDATEPQPQLHIPPANDPSPEHKAAQLRNVVPAAYLYGAASGIFHDTVDLASCQVYLNQLLQSAGNPQDPIARMMVEQLAMAHHAIGRLHVRAATRESLPEVVAFHGVLARLMSEFRKTSLALQVIRATVGEQTRQREQQAEAGQFRTADRAGAKEAVAAVASVSEMRSKDEIEGRERKANYA